MTVHRYGGPIALVGILCLLDVPTLRAQAPTVSPRLERALARDTDRLTVWLFARRDLPLRLVEAAARSAGGTVRVTSRWLHAVSADLTPAAVDAMRRNTDLRHLQPVAAFVRSVTPSASPAPSAPSAPSAPQVRTDSLGPSAMPFRRLNLLPLLERGFRGAGVRIAVFGTGFETGLPAFAGVTVTAQRDFVFGDSVVRNEPGDVAGASRRGTQVWSLLAANVPDTLIGIAPDAAYLLAKVEDVRQRARVEEDHVVAAFEWADSVGVDVVTVPFAFRTFDDGSSYQFGELNGDITPTTIAADEAARRGIIVIAAMGDEGPDSRSLGAPADGDSVIAVGAEDSLGVLAAFSSRGPAGDSRIKPDFTAPGVGVQVLTPSGAQQTFTREDGTAYAAAVLSGAAALFREVHPTLGPDDVRTAFRTAASNAPDPDTLIGWGTPDGFTATAFPAGVTLLAPADTLAGAATPRIAWSAPGVPAFALPVVFRLEVRDAATQTPIADTSLSTTSAVLPPLPPGTRFRFTLTATAADSATVTRSGPTAVTVPAWVTLETFTDPAGVTIREVRPEFRWDAAAVLEPFGPITFDVAVFREDNGAADAAADGLTQTTFRPDVDLQFNTAYRWRVIARLGGDSALVESPGTFVVVRDDVPTVTTLFQNFPNPFPNRSIGLTSTCLWFDLASDGVITLEILDVRGHLVTQLLPNDRLGAFLRAGRYGRPAIGATGSCDPDFAWDGRADDGRRVAGGLYLARLSTPDGEFFRRIVYLGPDP